MAQQLQSRRLQFNTFNVDAGAESGRGYDATTAWGEISGADQNGTERKFEILQGDGDPNGDTNHDNAPLGSFYFDYTSVKWYVKTAASTWTVFGSHT